MVVQPIGRTNSTIAVFALWRTPARAAALGTGESLLVARVRSRSVADWLARCDCRLGLGLRRSGRFRGSADRDVAAADGLSGEVGGGEAKPIDREWPWERVEVRVERVVEKVRPSDLELDVGGMMDLWI